MLRLADVVRRHGPAYMDRHGASMLPSHVHAVKAILRCRTPEMGGHLAACPRCGSEHLLYHSCRHRACPRGGYDATTRWLCRQHELLLPVLFQAAFASLAALCADLRYLGARIGALAVLHTWTRTLEYHPHVHMLVPGGGLAPDGRTWLATPRRRTRYLVPERALAKLFRGRFLGLARRALPGVVFPHIPWGK